MVKGQDEFVFLEHRILEVVAEFDGIVRTNVHTQVAEHARAQVVLILDQYFFLFPVGIFTHFGRELDGAVRTIHLTQPARDAMVVILFVVNHCQPCTVAFGNV